MVAFYPKPTRSRVLLHGHIKVRQALGRSCGREGASRFVGTGVDAGDVRCRLLPAEHAAAVIDLAALPNPGRRIYRC